MDKGKQYEWADVKIMICGREIKGIKPMIFKAKDKRKYKTEFAIRRLLRYCKN